MAKNKQTVKMQKRDWVIVILSIAVVATNWVWYQHHQAQQISIDNASEAWVNQQVQINKLKACVDEGTKPCDISPY